MSTGINTSEFKVSALFLPVLGLLLVAASIFGPNLPPEQRSNLLLTGVGLVGVGGASYTVSRGIAKIGAGAPPEPPPSEDDAAKKVAELK